MLFVLLAHVAGLAGRTTTAARRRLGPTHRQDAGHAGDPAQPGYDPEAGLTTLEIVIISLGLFLLAAAAVAVITAAVNGRLSKIT